jgi:hypothetical protein
MWTTEEKNLHINHLELLAVLKVLRLLAPQLKGQAIHLFMDNQVAISYLQKFKGGKKEALNQTAKEIWSQTVVLDIEISQVTWVPSQDNQADWESRFLENQGWRVQNWVFQKAERIWGKATVDRFASHRNAKTQRFNSESWCPDTEAVDAFTQDWSQDLNWAVPPPDLIWKTIRLIREQKARAIMVVPVWPNKIWWHQLEELVKDQFLLPNPEHCFQGKEDSLPFKRGWRWKVCLLEGSRSSSWS